MVFNPSIYTSGRGNPINQNYINKIQYIIQAEEEK